MKEVFVAVKNVLKRNFEHLFCEFGSIAVIFAAFQSFVSAEPCSCGECVLTASQGFDLAGIFIGFVGFVSALILHIYDLGRRSKSAIPTEEEKKEV